MHIIRMHRIGFGMIKVNIEKLLKSRNRDIHWLREESGISIYRINNLMGSDAKFIKYKEIAVLCNIFECDANTLLVEDKTQKER